VEYFVSKLAYTYFLSPQLPIQWASTRGSFPGCKAAEAWSWPLTYI